MSKTPNTKTISPEFEKLIVKGRQEYDQIKPWYEDRAETLFEVHCKAHGEIIALEAVMPNKRERGHLDGAVVIPLGNQLTSFRLRGDGSMGYACQCGANSILLKEEAILNETHAMYPHIEEQIKTELDARTRAATTEFKRVKVK